MDNNLNSLKQIGISPWSQSEIRECLDEFVAVYKKRPIYKNVGGMQSTHMFATWFMVKKLSPDLIVESGVWKGQSTWLLQQACPAAEVVSIDPHLSIRKYISDKVTYFKEDFSEQDWSQVTDRSLVFFDDHQNAYKRLQQCKWFGFKHIIFEDNYPSQQGDFYSLKKAFAGVGFEPLDPKLKISRTEISGKVFRKIARMLGVLPNHLVPQYDVRKVRPQDIDSKMLQKNLDIYYEFPPLFKTKKLAGERSGMLQPFRRQSQYLANH